MTKVMILISLAVAALNSTDAVVQATPYISLSNSNADRCLGVHYGRHNRNGGPVSMYPCVTSIDQKWQEIGDDPVWKQLKNLSTGRCLSTGRPDSSGVTGATISDCAEAPNQFWRRSRDRGQFTVVNRESGRCLRVDNRNDGGGATVGGCPVSPPAIWRKIDHDTLTATCGLPARLAGGDNPLWLPKCHRHVFTHGGNRKELIIYYTESGDEAMDNLRFVDTTGDGRADLAPREIARRLAVYFESTWRTYLDYGFGDPDANGKLEVHVFEMGKPGWCCRPLPGTTALELSANTASGAFAADSDPRSDVRDLKATIYHEMFHAVERKMQIRAPSEALATLLEDHVSSDVDNYELSGFTVNARVYLREKYRTTLNMHDYIGALWWKYFTENAADQASEPGAGIAAIRATWEHRYPHSNAAMDLAIGGYVPDLTHENLWVNFTVANIAKDFHGEGGVSVPRRYRYRDEEQGAPSLGSIDNFAVNQNIEQGDVTTGTWPIEIQPRSAQYFVVRPGENVGRIEYDMDQSAGEFLSYTTLVIGGGEFRENGRKARDFRETLRNVAGKTVILIVTGPPFVQRTTLQYRISAG